MNASASPVAVNATLRNVVLSSSSSPDAWPKKTTAADPLVTAPAKSSSGSVQLDVHSGASPGSRSDGGRLMPMIEQAGTASTIAGQKTGLWRNRGTT